MSDALTEGVDTFTGSIFELGYILERELRAMGVTQADLVDRSVTGNYVCIQYNDVLSIGEFDNITNKPARMELTADLADCKLVLQAIVGDGCIDIDVPPSLLVAFDKWCAAQI